jgi:hypothetical protein
MPVSRASAGSWRSIDAHAHAQGQAQARELAGQSRGRGIARRGLDLLALGVEGARRGLEGETPSSLAPRLVPTDDPADVATARTGSAT